MTGLILLDSVDCGESLNWMQIHTDANSHSTTRSHHATIRCNAYSICGHRVGEPPGRYSQRLATPAHGLRFAPLRGPLKSGDVVR